MTPMVVIFALILGLVPLLLLFLQKIPAPHGATFAEQSASRHLLKGTLFAFATGGLFTLFTIACISGLGLGLTTAPLAAGTIILAILVATEITMPKEAGHVRRASISARRFRDVIPRLGLTVAIVGVLSLGAILAIGIVTASPDDQGIAGRAVTWSQAGATETVSPWPGLYYAGPMLLGTAALTIILLMGLRAAYRRPQINSDYLAEHSDAQLRVKSATTMLSVALVTLGLSLLGVSSFMLAPIRGVHANLPAWLAWAGSTAVGGLLVGLACIVVAALGFVRSKQ